MTEISRTSIGVMTYLTPSGSLGEAKDLTALEKTVAECLEAHEINLILDLADVPSINGITLEALLDIQDKLARLGGSLKIVNTNQLTRDIFTLTGFGEHVSFMD